MRDQLKDHGYDKEEEYFKKQEKELIEKMKKKRESRDQNGQTKH